MKTSSGTKPPFSSLPLLSWDIGGTHVTAAIVDGTKIENRTDLPVDNEASAKDILGVWTQAGIEAAASFPSLVGGALAMPGPFDYARGVSHHQTKFRTLNGLNIAEELSNTLQARGLPPLRLSFTNDAGCFALGEATCGPLSGVSRVIGVTLGTGVGSGFVSDGHVMTSGKEVPPEGQIWWTTYKDGMAEDYVGTRALSTAYRERCGADFTPLQIAERAFAGDEDARATYAQMGRDLGYILMPWIERFRPQGLVLGGNICRSKALFDQSLRAALPSGFSLHYSQLGEDAALLGAARAWRTQRC